MIEKAYAKINLTLEIIGKKDNFHMLESIVVPVNIYDTLKFEKHDEDIVLSNVEIKDNNIYKAIALFKETYGIKDNVKITLNKKIPIGYGVGGSSADLSATLRGLNKLFNVNAPIEELEDLANALGSDTLFSLHNKRVFIYGRGDKIKFLDEGEKLKFILIYPKTHLLTKDVFKAYALNKKNNYVGFLNRSMEFILKNLKNDLLDAACSLSDDLKDLYNKLKDNNLDTSLTGSGPALFIVNPTEEEINKVKEILKDKIKYEITEEK